MHSNLATDDGLASRLRQKDPAAWESLYRDLYPRLRAYASKRVGDQSSADIVAETMAKAVASIDGFDPNGPGAAAWIFGICRHVIADHYRAAGRSQRRSAAPFATTTELGDTLEIDEEAGAMRAAYQMLSEDDREILDLRVLGGLSADEVASVLDRRAGAIRMAQSRALSRLRNRFEEVYR